jgi:outer membrane biosynthesis protein TonB
MRSLVRGLPLLSLCLCLPALADVPPSVTQAATPVATPVHSCAEIRAFKDKLHKAIDAALKYPRTLSLHPLVGVTSIAYDYADGNIEDAHITMWSGEADLDRLALAAVKNADVAGITPRIDDERIHDVVIIIYDNTGDPDNADVKKGKKAQDIAESKCDP